MGIETTALTDIISLADPSAAPAARPGNPDFAPFLTLATVTNAPASPMMQPGQPLDEAMFSTLPTPLPNVAAPALPGVGKPTLTDEPVDGAEGDAMLQSAYDIVQQLASNTAPAKPAVSVVAEEAAPVPVLPAIVVAPKPQSEDQTDTAHAVVSDGEDKDDTEVAPLPLPPVVVPAPIAVAPPPAPVAAAVAQEQPEVDAAPLPPKASVRPSARSAAPVIAPAAAAVPEAEQQPVAAPAVPVQTAPTAQPVEAKAAPATLPAAAPAPFATKNAETPAEHEPEFAEAVAPQKPAASPTVVRHDVAAPAPARVDEAASTAPAATPVGVELARALDDLVVAGANDDQWINRLASDIQTLAKGDIREAKLQLRPQELGGMAIKLEMEDRQTRVHFTVESTTTRELIAEAAPRLQHLVEARGFQLDHTTIEVRPPSEAASSNNSNGNGSSANANTNGSSAGTGQGSGRQGQQGHEPQNFRAPRATAEARAAARALASGKFERFA